MSQPFVSSGSLRVRAASELMPRSVDWLWSSWLPQGKLAILDGDPGLGKSLITLDLCARLSTGRPMPDGSPGPGPVNTLVLNAEDGAEDTINQRLEALGADRDRVFVVDRDEMDWTEPVRLPSQIGALEKVAANRQTRLVVIDPILAFLEPCIQINNDQSVRRALFPLHQLATRLGCVVLLVRHLNKQNDGRARYRGCGSIGFQGACRCTWLVGRDPEHPERSVLAQVKNNLAAVQGSLAYTVSVQPGSAEGGRAGPVKLNWLGSSSWGADHLLAVPLRDSSALFQNEKARQFLEDFLVLEPRLVREIWEAGLAQGLSERTLRRAKGDLKIRTIRVGKGREHHAYWGFKDQPLPDGIPPEDVPPDLSPWLDPLIEAYPQRTPLEDD